jgi:alpha-beta hydrolase superfamily lysophospholipase
MRDPDLTVKLVAVNASHETIRRTEDCLRAVDGTELFHRAWMPVVPRRVLVVVHGFGEHSGRYEEIARWFARRGFAVHATDLRGHGRTPGKRGHAADFEVLLDDLAGLLDFVSQQHPGLGTTLLGHSMGGLLTTAFVCERQPSIERFVVSGPALALSPDLSRVRMTIARLLRRFLPRITMEAGLDAAGLSRDPEVVRSYLEDPLVHGRISAAMAAGMLDAQIRTAASANLVSVPMLLLHGESDPLCLVEGSRTFFEGLPRERVAGSRLRTYPGLKHEILNEPERVQIYQDLLDWIDEPVANRTPDRLELERRLGDR